MTRGFNFGAYERRGLAEAAGIWPARGGSGVYQDGDALLMVVFEREGDREAHEQEGGSAAGEAQLVAAHRGRGAGSRGGAGGHAGGTGPAGEACRARRGGSAPSFACMEAHKGASKAGGWQCRGEGRGDVGCSSRGTRAQALGLASKRVAWCSGWS
ncbi:glycine-rich protein 1-like [Panicum hallii]|uniref:glycine-rich protein 1-like n=1 Tax=Panicum hallii TaxID=206008 RepID=UPI000DF4E884|nr:glycine-rich protein 1-like [Panicum hallii]